MSEAPPAKPPAAESFREVPGVSPEALAAPADEKARAEATAISDKTLDQEAKVGAHRRREQFRDAIARGALFLFWLFISGVAFSAFAAGWHALMPASCGWLDPSQLSTIRTFLTSGVLATAATQYVSHNLSSSN